ncbi:hypothetical protein BI350_12460 [Sporosarcina ureilytica]|uniref:Uncharacterized protein n=1 Tax=Sporosarcina ureilytica TaxID=298596 RepID=A0A1D8JHR2_9BACL|nr:hypothetical protein BI350_12460 [Sporosarcina ureilytica]
MIGVESGDSCGISESRHEERLLRIKAKRYEQECSSDALISAKKTQIRQIAIYALLAGYQALPQFAGGRKWISVPGIRKYQTKEGRAGSMPGP